MRIAAPTTTRAGGLVRSQVTIGSDREAFEPFDLFSETPAELGPDQSAGPFVPMALTLASWFGEDLVVESPIATDVLDSVRRAAPVVAAFHRRLEPSVTAPTFERAAWPVETGRVALCFSRGVDSSWTALQNEAGRLDPRADIALVIEGLEWARDERDRRLASAAAARAAAQFDLEVWRVRTNVFAAFDALGLYWPAFHGPVMAGVGFLLRDRLDHLVVSSSGSAPLRRTRLLSHPDLDPLLSLPDLGVHHPWPDVVRTQRVADLVADGRALDWLRVCWREPLINCGTCRKCKETALLLAEHGALERARTFPPVLPSAEDLRREPVPEEFREDLAGALSDPALAAAASSAAGGAPLGGDLAPGRLRRLAIGPQTRDATLGWVVVGAAGAHTAGTVDALADLDQQAVVVDPATLPTGSLRRLFASCATAVIADDGTGADDVVDLVVDALAAGSTAAVHVPSALLHERRAHLGDRRGELVLDVDGLRALAREDATVRPDLAGQVAAGGLARRARWQAMSP